MLNVHILRAHTHTHKSASSGVCQFQTPHQPVGIVLQAMVRMFGACTLQSVDKFDAAIGKSADEVRDWICPHVFLSYQ
jgi:hypothetical protein